MIEVSATLFTLMAEGFALACVLLITLIIVSARRKGKDRKALRALVADINEEAAERLQRTQTLLADGESAKALSRHERGVCQAFIGAYNKRAADSVTGTYAALKTLVDAYQKELQQLQESRAAAQPEDDGETKAKDVVLSKLKSEHEQTTRELEITKRTMDKMLREYSSMFAGGSSAEEEADGDGEIEAAEILQMLEQSKTDDEAATDGDDAAQDTPAADGETAADGDAATAELAAALDIAVADAESDSAVADAPEAAPIVMVETDDETAAEAEAVIEFAEEDAEEEDVDKASDTALAS